MSHVHMNISPFGPSGCGLPLIFASWTPFPTKSACYLCECIVLIFMCMLLILLYKTRQQSKRQTWPNVMGCSMSGMYSGLRAHKTMSFTATLLPSSHGNSLQSTRSSLRLISCRISSRFMLLYALRNPLVRTSAFMHRPQKKI